ncbi:MAG: hypothetical protein IID40_08475 [Planctomycetes bacterium]|nr:hypothetical protein [Planctomycetota bacterium]
MSREELATLVQRLDTVRESTERYRDVDVALADGFTPVTDEVPNMGIHFVSARRSFDGVFDPAEPEVLLYVRDEAGDLELVGTSFVLPIPLVSPDHPEAFAGPLDNWHVHFSLCLGSAEVTRSMLKDDCLAAGGCPVYYLNLVNNGTIESLGTEVLNVATADADDDGDVDLDDYAFFHTCLVSPGPQFCLDRFDGDHDGDLDLFDFAHFQRMFTGL